MSDGRSSILTEDSPAEIRRHSLPTHTPVVTATGALAGRHTGPGSKLCTSLKLSGKVAWQLEEVCDSSFSQDCTLRDSMSLKRPIDSEMEMHLQRSTTTATILPRCVHARVSTRIHLTTLATASNSVGENPILKIGLRIITPCECSPQAETKKRDCSTRERFIFRRNSKMK